MEQKRVIAWHGLMFFMGVVLAGLISALDGSYARLALLGGAAAFLLA